MRWYIDTSAALKLIEDEAESNALASMIDENEPDLVGALLLETELRRAVHRDAVLTQAIVSDLLDGISLFDMPRSLYTEAGLVAGANLRPLDALHIVTAVRCGASTLLPFDLRVAEGARTAGLTVLNPRWLRNREAVRAALVLTSRASAGAGPSCPSPSSRPRCERDPGAYRRGRDGRRPRSGVPGGRGDRLRVGSARRPARRASTRAGAGEGE